MGLNMSLNLFVRFYTTYGGIQNMWIEKQGIDGARYEVNTIEEAKNAFEDYITSCTN